MRERGRHVKRAASSRLPAIVDQIVEMGAPIA
jgi:hypothetical protein